jgi:hypothetical protein
VTLINSMAEWAVDIYRNGNLPWVVRDAAAAQRMSVFAALAATGAVRPAAAMSEAQDSVESELYRAIDDAAALDFDDYLCFGHAGLSSVLVAAIVAARQGPSGSGHDEVVAAQAVASELHARVAGTCLLSVHGPTQWAYSHAVSAAAAAGLLMGLDAAALSHALAIALAQPAIPARAAFFGPDTRSLTIANATLLGLRAAHGAGDGRTGPLRILDDRSGGVLRLLTRSTLPEMVSGLGTGWALRTLSVKTRPSCSYVDPALDALLELLPIAPREIDRIEVSATLPTVLMTRLARRYLPDSGLTPSIAAFSVPLSMALALHHGRLTPDEVTPHLIRAVEPDVLRLAERIVVRHSPRLTRACIGTLTDAFPVHRVLARRLLRRSFPKGRPVDGCLWSADALAAFRMAFPVRLAVHLHTGKTLRASADVPDGAAGSSRLSPAEAAEAKLAVWAERAWGRERAARVHTAILTAAHRSWQVVADH